VTQRKILVFGETGQVARALAARPPRDGLVLSFAGRSVLDLGVEDPGPLIREVTPNAVINAAAYTAVDRAETESAAADQLNRAAPAAMARACAEIGVPLVHISTDYVFDGSKGAPYVETDPLKPLGVYGATKAAGEAAVEAAGGRHAILRTSWVYGDAGSNFMKTMLRLATTRDEIGVVADQRGAPTLADDVAEGALRSALRLLDGDDRAEGLFHLTGGGDTTWADFARAIFEASHARGGPSARVNDITTADYPTPARRPADSRLSTEKFLAVHDWRPAPWKEGLNNCMARTEI